ncbi:hypothetical protein TSAR_009727 [Trichomalopsis sarcophagae]|uniref:Protein kintoun n=1 Tax=Trichomalopsis sarcophagae TaxID=543379 RepID=A0A232EW70_9HYME|nr:hypothetical protein TSAR_009727 [Trichomalopsis sarcophagae]
MEAYEDRKKDWEELEVTREELDSLTECMKKDEFRKLLLEYAEEVSDPENRARYESEIRQLERERGVDVTFVNPEPGYVIKTSLDGRLKCFLNVGQSEHVGKPSSTKCRDDSTSNGPAAGLSWSIPYILAPPRDDLDKSRQRCRVFDVVFHPDTLYLAERNSRFRQIVNDTALDGVENSFKVKLDRKNLKFPKMSFKGVSQPTVIRKPCEEPAEKLDIEPEIYQKLMSTYDEKRERRSKSMEGKSVKGAPTTKYYNSRTDETENNNSDYTTPKFIVKHQSNIKMDEFMESRDAKMHSAIPENLVIDINLPLLKTAADTVLDVQERHLSLKSERPAKYNLELPLSHRVDPDNGNAKFDSKLRKLIVTLPVIRQKSFLGDAKEDSGVESDHGSPVPESEDISNQLTQEESNDCQNLQNLLICDISENNNVQSDCADTALRTNKESNANALFMNPNVKYSLPAFTCNLYDNVLAVTVHAKNVDSESINHRMLENNAGLHILLSSIGTGFFPIYYSLCLKIEKDAVIPDTLTVEPWDNNVVISVKIKNAETMSRYFAGMDERFMEAKELSVGASIKNKLQALTEDPELETDKNVEVIRSEKEVTVNVRTQSLDSDDEDDHENQSYSQEERKRSFAQSRSVSESSGDELPSSIGSGSGSARYKSILKSRFSRSVSESSIDENTAPFSCPSVTFNHSISEFYSESEGSSLKKTVRFNDVVSRQLYRSNSSILGQRKKNQRKLRNKKRAHDRRLSESENSETDEREKYKVETKNESERNASDAVRPILLQANKRTETQKTANIEIERSPRSVNKRKQKRNAESSAATKNHDEKTENNSEAEESFESKNDLMFDLDI